MSETINIVPNQTKVTRLVFPSYDDFEKYNRDFYQDLEPELKKLEEARRRSVEEIRKRSY